MPGYTIVVMKKDEWLRSNNDIKNILRKYEMNWKGEVKELNIDEVKDLYKRFEIKLDPVESKEGMWESGRKEGKKEENILIKIVINEGDVVLIYKGAEKQFYVNMMKKCRDLGFLITKLVDGKVVFSGKINAELIRRLEDVNALKDIKVKNFTEKVKILECVEEGMDIKYSDSFIKEWVDCIVKDHKTIIQRS